MIPFYMSPKEYETDDIIEAEYVRGCKITDRLALAMMWSTGLMCFTVGLFLY